MANKTLVEVTGLKELIQRMSAFPATLAAKLAVTMSAALNVLWEKVPPYPPPPQDSSYRRTGTLGRSLGSSEGGGVSGGEPSIYTVRKLGGGNMEGKFGTNLEYAPYVIGEDSQSQAHVGRWWTIRTVAELAKEKIGQVFEKLGNDLAAFLEGKGS